MMAELVVWVYLAVLVCVLQARGFELCIEHRHGTNQARRCSHSL